MKWQMSKIIFTDRAFKEYVAWQSLDKKILKKINTLLKDIDRTPYTGIGKPEGLRVPFADIGADVSMM